MKNLSAKLIITLLLSSSLVACNTIRGVGQDIEAAGEALEKSAEKNKKY